MRLIHPGEIVRECFLEEEGLDRNSFIEYFSMQFRFEKSFIENFLNEKQNITPELANALAKHFETSNQYWVNMQNSFDKKSK